MGQLRLGGTKKPKPRTPLGRSGLVTSRSVRRLRALIDEGAERITDGAKSAPRASISALVALTIALVVVFAILLALGAVFAILLALGARIFLLELRAEPV